MREKGRRKILRPVSFQELPMIWGDSMVEKYEDLIPISSDSSSFFFTSENWKNVDLPETNSQGPWK